LENGFPSTCNGVISSKTLISGKCHMSKMAVNMLKIHYMNLWDFHWNPLVLLMNPKFLMHLLHLNYRHQSLASQFTVTSQLFAPGSYDYWSSDSLPQPLLWQYCTTCHKPKKGSKFKVHFLSVVCHFYTIENLKNIRSNHYDLEPSVVISRELRLCSLYLGLNHIYYKNKKVGGKF
jgi:hypothetical protein